MSPESAPPSTPPGSAAPATELPHSPAAERNAPHILQVLQGWLPPQARVLEVASGTGQHAQHFAAAMPGWQWWPTEASAAPLAAITTRCAGLAAVRAPLVLDVLATWPVPAAAFDAVYAANLLHIAPWPVTPAFMRGAARALRPGAVLAVYGPFIVDGEPLAPSNAAFDADLRARNPQWGLRVLSEVQAAAAQAGLALAERRALPANNLLLKFMAV